MAIKKNQNSDGNTEKPKYFLKCSKGVDLQKVNWMAKVNAEFPLLLTAGWVILPSV